MTISLFKLLLASGLLAIDSVATATSGSQRVTFTMPAAALHQACSATARAPDYKERDRLCTGYILGVLDGLTTSATWRDDAPIVCVPPTFSRREIVDSVRKSVLLHKPGDVNSDFAAATVFSALVANFPCAKQNP